MGIKSFINNYTPAGALYKAATGGRQLTDDAGDLWSKAVDDTGISATLGDAGQAGLNTTRGGLFGMITKKDPVEVAKESVSGGLVGMVTDVNPTEEVVKAWENTTEVVTDTAETVADTSNKVVDTVKETVQNVIKGVSGALPVLALGGAAVLLGCLLLRRR